MCNAARVIAFAIALAAFATGVSHAGAFAANDDVLPRIAFGDGDRVFARTGVAFEAASELVDAPPLLAEPEAQAFVDRTFASLGTLVPGDALRDRIRSTRAALRPARGGFDRTRAVAALAAFAKRTLDALPDPKRNLFLSGVLAQAIAYNARVLREPAPDAYRATLAKIGAADAVAPGLGDLRADLGKLEADDWAQSAALAHRAVAAILGGDAAVPFAAAPRIWTALVRFRPVDGRPAPHVALDVVWFDGHHQTFAAVPANGDYANNGDRMTCVRDREPQSGTLRAVPVAPPHGANYAELAASFERSCDALSAKPPPYIVADTSDARFVAAALSVAGIDPHAVLGAK